MRRIFSRYCIQCIYTYTTVRIPYRVMLTPRVYTGMFAQNNQQKPKHIKRYFLATFCVRVPERPRYGSYYVHFVFWGYMLVYLRAGDTASTGKGPTIGDVDISGLTVKELKAKCKKRGLGSYSQLNKAGLISLLEGMCVAGFASNVVLAGLTQPGPPLR